MRENSLLKAFTDIFHKALSFLKRILSSPVGRQRFLYGFLKRLLFLYLLFWIYAFIVYPEFVPRSLARLPEISIIIPFLFILVLLLPFFPQYLSSLSSYPLIYYTFLFGMLLYWIWDFVRRYQWDSRVFLAPSKRSEEDSAKEMTFLDISQGSLPEDGSCQRAPLSPSEKKQRLLCGFLKKLLYTYFVFWIYGLLRGLIPIPRSIEELFWLLIVVFLYLFWVLLCWPFAPQKGFIFTGDSSMSYALFYIIFLCLVSYWIWIFIRNGKFRTYFP